MKFCSEEEVELNVLLVELGQRARFGNIVSVQKCLVTFCRKVPTLFTP